MVVTLALMCLIEYMPRIGIEGTYCLLSARQISHKEGKENVMV
jgi:hypothetical protein